MEERLPVVGGTTTTTGTATTIATTVNGHSPDPPAAREEAGAGVGVGVAGPPSSSGGGAERTKRFPILGPTRQDTELYFRRRRSARRRWEGGIEGTCFV